MAILVAIPLCFEQQLVCPFEELDSCLAWLVLSGAHARAYSYADALVPTFQNELAERASLDLPGSRFRSGEQTVPHDDDELVAPPAAYEVVFTHDATYSLCHDFKELVALVMSIAIVDRLEAV